MSTFTLNNSYLITSNLPWFMDLTFQVTMQYCSLQHQTLLPSPVTCTLSVVFALAPSPHFFGLFLHWSSVAYWAPTYLGSSSLCVLYFCLFMLFMGFSTKEYWSGLPFPSSVDHILPHFVSIWSSNPTPGHISGENHNSKWYMHPNVYWGTIYNSQDMEAT